MPLLVPADFRAASLAASCVGIPLETSDVSNALLEDVIESQTEWLEATVGDRFNSFSDVIYLDGDGTSFLDLPFRTTAIYNLWTVDAEGTEVIESADAYRLHSSLDASGERRVGSYDFIEVTELSSGLTGTLDPFRFDFGTGTVKVEGQFGWDDAPQIVRRAVAQLVYNHVKPIRSDLRNASQYATADITVQFSDTTPTGLVAVDAVIAAYTRDEPRVG